MGDANTQMNSEVDMGEEGPRRAEETEAGKEMTETYHEAILPPVV